MKILHVYRSYFPDAVRGIPEAIRQICLGTKALGAEPSIFALSPRPSPRREKRAEGNLFRERSWAAPASCDLGGARALAKFRELAAATDIVHYHFPWPFGNVLGVLSPRAAAVATWHSDIVRQRALAKVIAPLVNASLRRVEFVAATSDAYARSSLELGRPGVREKVRAIPLGIAEPEGFHQAASPAQRRPFFLFLGALNYYKGLNFLLRAADLIGAHVVIAGDGPDRAALEAEASLMRRAKIEFRGHVSEAEKTELLSQCLALVLPSHLRSEAYGMVLVEASMRGTPMITCEIGTGTSFVNEHRTTGLVVPPADPASLAEAMSRLVSSPALSDAFGRGARARYEKLFSGRPTALAYQNLYSEARARRERT